MSEKSRSIALIFVLVLGIFGAHRFYVNKAGSATAILVLTLTGIGLFVSAVWVFVDFVMILAGGFTDKQGQEVKKW